MLLQTPYAGKAIWAKWWRKRGGEISGAYQYQHSMYKTYVMYNNNICKNQHNAKETLVIPVTEQATEVRKDFADFLDDAQRRPKFIKRRKYQYVVLSTEMLDALAPQKVELQILSDEGSGYYTECSVAPDVIGFGASEQETIESFANGLVSFCYEYYENFAFYSAAPNRIAQLPLVTKVVSHYERFHDIAALIKVA
jgi:hypothetical protein